MPFDTRPITPHELVEASAFNLTIEAAKLYVRGLSPGIGMVGHALLAEGVCRSRRYAPPKLELTDRRAVAARASAKLGQDKHGTPHFPVNDLVEALAASGGLGPRYRLDTPQVAYIGRALDEAWEEILAERLTARAAQ